MNGEKIWYAVYTKPRWEKKVAELLTKRKLENYCPLNRVIRQWSDRKKVIHEPLFSSYVFVHATMDEYEHIRKTDGVINFVYWLGKPAVIRDEEITAIKNFLDDYYNVKLQQIDVSVADRVRVTNGPLMNMEGDVLEVKSRSVKVFLPSLGYAMIAEIGKGKVEVINAQKSSFKVKENLS